MIPRAPEWQGALTHATTVEKGLVLSRLGAQYIRFQGAQNLMHYWLPNHHLLSSSLVSPSFVRSCFSWLLLYIERKSLTNPSSCNCHLFVLLEEMSHHPIHPCDPSHLSYLKKKLKQVTEDPNKFCQKLIQSSRSSLHHHSEIKKKAHTHIF